MAENALEMFGRRALPNDARGESDDPGDGDGLVDR